MSTEDNNLTPRGEHVELRMSLCGEGIATIVRGMPYVEITRDSKREFDVIRLLTLHEEKRIRRSRGEHIVTINDIIACKYE